MRPAFKCSDLDKEKIKIRAKREYEEIVENLDNLRGRSKAELLECCERGQAAEIWLLNNGYIDDDRKYCDVKDTTGRPVEVKVTECEAFVPFVINRCNKKKYEMRDRHASIVYVFINIPHEDDYDFYGSFHWDTKELRFVPKYRTIEDIEI